MSNYQIRIRTDVEWEQLDYIAEWLQIAKAGFAFEHKKPNNHHYHIYLFGLERNDDAMRRYLGKHLPSKECYAVSMNCGKKKKRPIEPQGAYTYGTTMALIDHNWSKGFSNEELEKFQQFAKDFYKGSKEPPVEVPQKKEKVVRVPYQQAVVATAAADWINYKKEQEQEEKQVKPADVVQFVCNAMREHGRGINPYLVKDLGYAVLYDDLDFRERILNKLKYEFNL